MEKLILTPREVVLPEITTLSSEILGVYNEGIASYDEKARKVLGIFSDRNGDLTGSNCFAPIELRKYFPKESRLATMADLGRATEINPQFLSGFYADFGLTLRTAGDSYGPNDSLAKKLVKQLEKRNINLKHPKVIYFDALDLREDKDSHYGLVYVLSEKAKVGENIIDVPELIRNYQFRTMNEKGIPIEDEKGNRTCYTRQDGLSWFCLGGYSNVDSDGWYLAGSDDGGRVVVVKTSEAGRAEFEKHLSNLQKERDRKIAEINNRYKEAEKVLRGN